jgi:hypothetical protein
MGTIEAAVLSSYEGSWARMGNVETAIMVGGVDCVESLNQYTGLSVRVL